MLEGAGAGVSARTGAYVSFCEWDEQEKAPAQASKLVRALKGSCVPPRGEAVPDGTRPAHLFPCRTTVPNWNTETRA